MLLQGKNAIVTGCARGIGRKILAAFAGNGANVWACCRLRTAEFDGMAEQLSQSYQVRVTPLCFDLTDGAATKEAMKTVMAEKVPVDILVNNAGITYNALYQMTSMEKMREVFEVNFFAQIALTQYVIKLMARQRAGCIINISSTAALDANPGRGAYGASKAAVACMTRVMAHELAEKNIRVNAIAPGYFRTDMPAAVLANPRATQSLLRKVPQRRIAEPEEIGPAVLFLASPASSFMTGAIIYIDGGYTAA